MKYCVIIMDGAAGRPLPQFNGLTTLEQAVTPGLNSMAASGMVGMTSTIPEGMEPSSSNGCMSVLGYDPSQYYVGRAVIEARSMGIPVEEGDVLFRCNLVSIADGTMHDYSAGHISTAEAVEIVETLNKELGSDTVEFFPGLNYRHILKLKGKGETLQAACTPPHDISGRGIAEYLPCGEGSDYINELMQRSEAVLNGHPVNQSRRERGESTADTIWLFWGSAKAPEIPSFSSKYGLNACVTSAVDVIRGLAQMLDIDVLDIPGVTDGLDNDFAGQVTGALKALETYDLAVVHIEAPDEEGHSGSAEHKVEAIRRIDDEVISRVLGWNKDSLRVLVMPDHPTPVELKTHSGDPVPFLLWGDGVPANGASRFTEKEADKTGLTVAYAHTLMSRLTGKG